METAIIEKSEKVPLARLAIVLRGLAADPAQVPAYRTLYHLIVSGAAPAEWINGRWYVTPGQLREIAKLLGLKLRKAA